MSSQRDKFAGGWRRTAALWSVGIVFALMPGAGFSGTAAPEQGKVLSTEGKVQFAREKAEWTPAANGQKLQAQDRLRTLKLSRALVQLVELGRVRLDELTTLEILPPRNPQSKGTLDLKAGAMYFFTRDRPREFEIKTPQALAASRGTEFLVSLESSGREVFVVFDGEVDVSNSLGAVTVAPGEQGIVEPGQPPRKTAVIQTRRIVQWWLYYPAILDPAELSFTPTQRQALAPALEAYRQGDLLRALEIYPEERTPENESETIFHAALLLSVGQVEKAEALLANANASAPAAALRLMMNTVQLRDAPPLAQARTATEHLANSYALQSRFDLASALAEARKATDQSPNLGFAWARVAELEFSFGHSAAASTALGRALSFSPGNAQAWALKGFLSCQQSQWAEARDAFEMAISLDPALGNGWLGLGLVRIRLGDELGGRADLQTAAALEPNRSLLRSYLGKAFGDTGDAANSRRELALAKHLDAGDPTPWLYSALILHQQLRYNEAVTDLEKSAELNDNRSVYRSRLLLDEDRAVRSASLARVYRGAGMDDVSVREAARAVTDDYANYSAHQFLAESFYALRDPTQFSLRVETVWFNELLLGNLLSPVGGGHLSQNISAQEYSRLFDSDRFGFSSTTQYRSDGQTSELASQFGTVGKFSYAFDLGYQHNDGVRPNNELDRIEWYTTAKYQLTPEDSLFLLVRYQDYHSGDNFQYYDPNGVRTDLATFGITNAPVIRTNFSFTEYQKPVAVLGYHHEWAPGVHTLALGGRLNNDQRFHDEDDVGFILQRTTNPPIFSAGLFDIEYRNVLEVYTFELNQIVQTERHLSVFGLRYQSGTFDTRTRLTLVDTNLASFFSDPPADQNISTDFERMSAYGYHTWEMVPNLHLTGGVAYDRVMYPVNYRYSPIAPGSTTQDQWSPKAAVVWNPLAEVTVRGVYTKSLGGVGIDEYYRLEPTQLAGFSQAFRNLIPESVVGSVSVPRYETAGAALDLKFKTRTYAGVQAEFLKSEVDRQIGVFDYSGAPPPPPPVTTSSTSEHLRYQEPSVAISVNQLVSDIWSFGAQYRFTRSQLDTRAPEIPPDNRNEQADLHQARFFVALNHPSGFFARFESLWYHQENSGYTPALEGDDFFQHNLLVGYRLRRQYGEITFGVLNLTDNDYRLNPLNQHPELPRERVYAVRLSVNF